MKVSNCCGASIIENTDLCSDCKEHCSPVEEEVFYEGELKWLGENFTPKKVTYNGKEIT